jgi:hypothetical protein
MNVEIQIIIAIKYIVVFHMHQENGLFKLNIDPTVINILENILLLKNIIIYINKNIYKLKFNF